MGRLFRLAGDRSRTGRPRLEGRSYSPSLSAGRPAGVAGHVPLGWHVIVVWGAPAWLVYNGVDKLRHGRARAVRYLRVAGGQAAGTLGRRVPAV